MSVKVMSQVWEYSKATEGALLIMLSLADWANDDGEAWPSIPQLATKSRLSVRQVQYALRSLEAAGELYVQHSNGGRHRRSTYFVTVSETMQSAQETMQTVQSTTETVQSTTETVQSTAPVVPITVNNNRHLEPSFSAGARELQAEQRSKLMAAFGPIWGEHGTEERIEECLAYPFARTKGRNWYLTARTWLRNEAKKENVQHGQHPANTSRPAARSSDPAPSEYWDALQQQLESRAPP